MFVMCELSANSRSFSGPKVKNFFFMLNLLEHEIQTSHKYQNY